MADGLDLIDIYAEEEFIQESEFAAEQVDLYDDVLAATVAPSDEQQSGRRGSQTLASARDKSNHHSTAVGYGIRKPRSSVYVGNFAWWTTDQQLETLIRSVGVRDLIELKFAENRANGQSKGYAEIVVGSETSASQLLTNLVNQKVHGESLDVRSANKQNLSFFETMSRKRIPPRAKDSMDGTSQPVEKPATTASIDKPPNAMPFFNHPPFMEPPRVPVMNMPHMMNIPPPIPPRVPPPVTTAFRGPMPPPGLQYQQMMAPPPRLPPHMTGPPPVTVPPALHLNPAFFPPPNTALPPPPNPYDKGPPNPFANRPPNAFNNRPPNPYSRPPNPYDKAPPNTFGKGPPNPYNKGLPSPYGKMMNNPYMAASKEMGHRGPGMSDEEFEEIMNRNRAISSSAISKAVSGASSGEYNTAAKTLLTAIAVIKESRVANDARCRVLLSSLKDCLRGIETKSGSSRKRHRSRERSTSRSRESRSGSRRHRDGLYSDERQEEYYERHRERDRHH